MSEDLISKEHAKVMRTIGPWEDGDLYNLGGGIVAEYAHRKRLFVVREKGSVIGEVGFDKVMGKSKRRS